MERYTSTGFLFQCIHATAQKLAEEFNYTITAEEDFNDFQYCSAKYSRFQYEDQNDVADEDDDTNIPNFAKNNSNYMEVQLEKDSHFYDISVNTNISCVHVPTNIYYKGIIDFSISKRDFSKPKSTQKACDRPRVKWVVELIKSAVYKSFQCAQSRM